MENYYYNYYNVAHRYSCQSPEFPDGKKNYVVTTNEIKSNNNSQDSDAYKAYCKLEDTYYNVSVSNRSKYKTERELYAALNQKYSAHGAYSQYSSVERNAMYENELNMTLFGCLNGGGNVDDPHVGGNVDDPTDSEKQSYNRQMVNLQLNTLLSSSGIDLNQLSKYNIPVSLLSLHKRSVPFYQVLRRKSHHLLLHILLSRNDPCKKIPVILLLLPDDVLQLISQCIYNFF